MLAILQFVFTDWIHYTGTLLLLLVAVQWELVAVRVNTRPVRQERVRRDNARDT